MLHVFVAFVMVAGMCCNAQTQTLSIEIRVSSNRNVYIMLDPFSTMNQLLSIYIIDQHQ